MGCDGGTIPRRDELVRVKKKPEQKDKDAEREFRWLHCALTQERLQEPIVMCGLGRLYSRQNVIEQLLEKDKMPESAKHIKSMKDIRTLTLTPNPSYTDEDKSEGLLDSRHAPYICKLIGLEMSGKFRFIALWSCGCVMSERALKQIKSTASICPLCQAPFSVEDVVVLNGGDEDLEVMLLKIEMRNAKRKASKKDKKEKKDKKATTTVGEISTDVPKETPADEAKASKETTADGPSTSKAATSSDNQVPVVAAANGATTKLTSSKTKVVVYPKRTGNNEDAMQDPELKRLKTEYSVAKDPKASDVYKSLFTSHKSEQEQTRAHWVTYNPFYN